MDRKMFFYLVVLLCLSWPRVTGAGNKKEAAFDQIATASENVAQNVGEKVEQRRDNFRDQLITSIIDTTVHYENSNGFVPILVSSSPPPFDPRQQLDGSALKKDDQETINVTLNNSLNENENSSRIDDGGEAKETRESDDFVNDPLYSTEARILLNFSNLNSNRRSFEYQANHNDFDLLKVRNDTPEIANYPNLYEESSGGNILDKQSSKRGETKDQKTEGYVGNYGMVVSPSSGNDEGNSYSFYYSADPAEDKERKRSHDREKVGGNYQQRYVTGYGGQNELSASSFPSPNQGVFLKTNVKNDGTPSSSSSSSSSSSQLTNSHKFSRPVVVAEPTSYNKFDQPSGISDLDDYQTSRIIEGSEASHRYTMNNRDGRFENDEDSRDTSDDSDYVEYTERPRKVQQKSRRRPNGNSKRLPKEHRGSAEDSAEEHKGKAKHHSSRSRQAHRQRTRGSSWSDEDRHREQEDSYEDVRYDGRLSETRHAKFRPSTSWNQISPNLEISHSSGIEIDQLEKPKLIVPVKVNLVPTSFDHATAIGSSQGFDVSNAILRNIVSNTANAASINSGENEGKIRVSTPTLPDIIVGQGNFRNSMHAVLPQTNGQQSNRFSPNLKPHYLSTTIAPVFTVSPNPNFQSVQIQEAQDTTRTSILADPSNQMSANNHQPPRLILPQTPTLQTLSVQTPVTGAADYIQVNPHGMHGQNPISHGNLQVQPLPTMPTITPTVAHAIPVTKINLITSESQGKNALLPDTDTNFLATASLAVGHNDQGQVPSNDNSYYLGNSNGQQLVNKQPPAQVPLAGFYHHSALNVPPSRTKTYVQTTNLLPAVLQPLPTYTSLSTTSQPFLGNAGGDQGQRFPNQAGVGDNGGSASNLRNVKFPSLAYQMIDSAGSHSTDNINTVNGLPGIGLGTGHLPHVGTRNVEIVNPNMKPDASIVNSYETMHYPAAVLTTSIPMFATTSFVTARPALLSSTIEPINAATATTEVRPVDDPTKPRPVYNPLNFVPNVDVVKSQNALNGKLHAVESLQQNLNLVPLLPGGNFFKPSFTAQTELLTKPKLTSDLQAYAEQMFKESLKTIYNTQKWNNDRKAGHNRYNITDSDIAKLRNELQRLKASLDSRKKKNHGDADHSETKVRTTELFNGRKPDESLMAALEQMLKKSPADSLHNFHGGASKPHRHRRPNEQDNYGLGVATGDLRDTKYAKEFFTPPQFNAHRGKNHFHQTEKPGKKRPGSSRYKNHNHHHNHHHHHHHHHGMQRSHPRSSSKAGGIEASGSNIEPVRVDGLSKYGNVHESRQFRKGSSFDSRLGGSTSPLSREKISHFSKTGLKGLEGKENAYNNPKMHNFYGMLMKNKQLPGGDTPNYFRDKDQLKQFFETEKQRMQQKFYDDAFRDYFKKMSDLGYSNSRISSSEKRKV